VQAAEIQQRSAGFDVHQEIHVTLSVRLAACDRAKDAHPAGAVVAGDPQHILSFLPGIGVSAMIRSVPGRDDSTVWRFGRNGTNAARCLVTRPGPAVSRTPPA
jgi:hypothetical protein